MRDIEQALMEHKEALIQRGFAENRILGIFLYGSQNYGLATEASDVDTKAIIVPTLEELCSFYKPYVHEFELPNGEKCVAMDIRHLIDNLKKQNINYVEVLFTKHNWVNPDYESVWASLLAIKEKIAFYDRNRAVQSMAHQALHTLKQDPFNDKKYAQAMYISHFLHEYIVDEKFRAPYAEMLHPLPHITEPIVEVKTGKTGHSLGDAYKLRKHFERMIEMKPFEENIELQKEIDKRMLQISVMAVRRLENL